MKGLRGFADSIRSLMDSFYTDPVHASTLVHRGSSPSADNRIKKILLVDDIPSYVKRSLHTIQKHYRGGEVLISLAYSYNDALTLFKEHNHDLVIMDYDLQDPIGTGGELTKTILKISSTTTVLANSMMNKFNEILLDKGAAEILGKDSLKLQTWLEKNDPMRS